MLLRFGVSNRLSIRDRQELSLTASSLKDPTGGLIDCPSVPGGHVLPAVLIYGANASGKSNLVDSLRVMREMVLVSHRKGEPGGGVPLRRPFALDPANSVSPTRFDIDFVMDGVRHHYGFETSDEKFLSEWLYAFPKGHRRTLFEREGDKFHFGSGVERAKQDDLRSGQVEQPVCVRGSAKWSRTAFPRVRVFPVDPGYRWNGLAGGGCVFVLRSRRAGRPSYRVSREGRDRNH